jgi:hypothetical protein
MIKTLMFILLGCMFGMSTTWLYFQSIDGKSGNSEFNYSDIFYLANEAIHKNKFACESFSDNRVGTVLASIFEQNHTSPLNRISRGCFENRCSISFGSCRPWQNDSCGSTILYFELNQNGSVDLDSLSCIQTP